jgi:alpha-L-fucosidase
MSNPNYSSLLGQIATAKNHAHRIVSDPVWVAANPHIASLGAQYWLDRADDLADDCYVFTEELTTAEKELFNYVSSDYIQDTPGTTTSYVGIYYGNSGIIS